MSLPLKTFSIAPMMAWTDRHCRYFHRLLSSKAILYTEMVTADAIIHGHREKLLAYDPTEHPVVIQLGGSDTDKLREATKIVTDYGYDSINLNVGCPSDRVQSGAFGACLMKSPALVADLIHQMQQVTPKAVTVKCRIGVDDDDPYKVLPEFIHKVHQAGCNSFIIHARKAWLQGLSPKENRDIPPLDYKIVYQIKQTFPNLHIGINGGIETIEACQEHLFYIDEVMLGRSAYHTPELLRSVDQDIYGIETPKPEYADIIEKMAIYCDRQIAENDHLSAYAIIRHMLGLFYGKPNARLWRRTLTEQGTLPEATGQVLRDAFHQIIN